jgi:YVTN family beta-propeller protein
MPPKRGAEQQQMFRRRRLAALTLVVVLALVIGSYVSAVGAKKGKQKATNAASTLPTNPAAPAATSPKPAVVVDRTYSEKVIATLAQPVEDPATAAFGATVRFAGGLDSQDTSTAGVVAVDGAQNRLIGQLPFARHDAAGAGLGGALYVFGGGDSNGQLNSIVRVDSSGTATNVGSLPVASSDSSAAVVGGTAYVVGGYDGNAWLDTILAYTPKTGAKVVAHLPTPLRYAAVGSAGGRIVIAGGSTPSDRATTAIYEFDPSTRVVSRLGDLPTALTHGSAAGISNEVVVVGGQDSSRSALDAIVAIDPTTRRVRLAGHLLTPRSDAGLAGNGSRLWIVGGHNSAGTLAGVSEIVDRATPTVSRDVYAHDGANDVSAVARSARALVYVPNSQSNTVDVIDQKTMKVVEHFAVGVLPQHVTPSWDLKTLYVDNDRGNTLTPIDPKTGLPRGPAVPVTDPYNLYFTPNGQYAIVVAEAQRRLDFRNPNTMALITSVQVPCRGIDHMDFTVDGTLALASCEFSGDLLVIDVHDLSVVRTITLPRQLAKPQDVKLSPDGTLFYVADMTNGGLWEIDAQTFDVVGFLPTGRGAHGLYPSRDAKVLYVSNRDEGTVSVVDFASRSVIAKWSIPGGSPDMGGVSVDGRVLWLSGRYNSEVYAISTSTGRLLARIPVGRGPHGLSVWPQPGRHSLGHTGVMR